MGYFDTHRHSEYSSFDGFGRPAELALYAKSIGYTALGLTDHGNTYGLVKHYYGCRKAGIKPILGVECYMMPKWEEKHRGYHLCLFAMTAEGYRNINTMQYLGERHKYYNPIVSFDDMAGRTDGVIASSACLSGYMARAILAGKPEKAQKFAARMRQLFDGRFYVEIQPYKVDSQGTQERVNVALMQIAEEMGLPMILTSDSHRGAEDDFETYLKMHEIAGHDLKEITDTYQERYMPTQEDIVGRFVEMHHEYFGSVDGAKWAADEMVANLEEIEAMVDPDIFERFEETLPVFDPSQDSQELLQKNVMQGLHDRGKLTEKYIDRAKEELETVFALHFEDYFLMVQDYVRFAKSKGIAVGPGRGSGCNFLINYALGITDVDSVYFDLEPRRFLMRERAKMPDIDIDFEPSRRGEVIAYLLEKYKGRSARICSYGLYDVDSLINDLAKCCGLPTDTNQLEETVKDNAAVIRIIKSMIRTYADEDGNIDIAKVAKDDVLEGYNWEYDNIITHFCKLYKKVRYIGTHAAGVAITNSNILERTALRIINGEVYTSYDLADMEDIGVIKFDMLGLKTLSELRECRELSGGEPFNETMLGDEAMLASFADGNCEGVFQFEKPAAQKMMRNIHVTKFNDVVAVNAMNRPGPLSLDVPNMYASNKIDAQSEKGYFDDWLGDTYGTILYQEQVMRMCVDIAGMGWDDAYMVSKMQIGGMNYDRFMQNDYQRLSSMFIVGCAERGIPEDVAEDTFRKFMYYSFNEGHATGYSLISAEQEYQKTHYPAYFWYAKIKYADEESRYYRYCLGACKDGVIIFLPHVNLSSAFTSLRKEEGEAVIQQGLQDIKKVGPKAAEAIVKERKAHGIFRGIDDFLDRMTYTRSPVNKGVLGVLEETGALCFNKIKYIRAVRQYNRSLYMRR